MNEIDALKQIEDIISAVEDKDAQKRIAAWVAAKYGNFVQPYIPSLPSPEIPKYKSLNWKDSLITQANKMGLNSDEILFHTDPTDLMEGIYIKVETEEETIGRFKFVRADFVNKLINENSHWVKRELFPNLLLNKY